MHEYILKGLHFEIIILNCFMSNFLPIYANHTHIISCENIIFGQKGLEPSFIIFGNPKQVPLPLVTAR